MSCVIYIIQTGDYISPVGRQKVTWRFFFNFEPCYCEKLIASLWQENSTRDLITELCTKVCVVVRSRGADRVCRLNVDHRNFARIDVDEFFKCRTENRILKYEYVKRYTFKGVKN